MGRWDIVWDYNGSVEVELGGSYMRTALEMAKFLSDIEGRHATELYSDDLIECVFILRELYEENERLKERLQISPCGDDKIDELEEALSYFRK
jgi:hypothetical protein